MSCEAVTTGQTSCLYTVVPMPGDGSCLFHSLSFLLHGNTLSTVDIRKAIVSYVCLNWNRFQVWTDDGMGNNYTSQTHYAVEMLRAGTYGSACELMAAAELFQCRFQVFRNGHLFYAFGEEGAPVKSLRFSGEDLGNGHFDAYEHISDLSDSKLNMQPIALLESLSSNNHNQLQTNEVETTTNTRKRTRRRGRFSDAPRRKQLRDASATYARTHPEVNRKSSQKYTAAHPQVNRNAVATYTQSHPEVNRGAVAKYTKTHREVNRAAVAKYRDAHPEVNRAAVTKYTDGHPEVNRAAVAKYTHTHPEVNRVAVATYTNANPQVNRASVSRYDATHEKRLLRKKQQWLKKKNSGFTYDPDIIYESDATITIGRNDVVCRYCNALKWKDEFPGLCCSGGKVHLTPFEKLPEPLHSLLTGHHPDSEHFLNHIRNYNATFQMTSFGGKQIIEGNFMPTFKVQGQVYHLMGSLLPTHNQNHKFLQIYFVGDDDKETDIRCANVSGVKDHLVRHLQTMLHNVNTYIRDFQAALDSIENTNEEFHVVIHADKNPPQGHKGRFNKPTAREVGIVIVGQTFENRDILLKSRDNKLQRIKETHRSYDALQYPLMFCYGEDGYSISVAQVDVVSKTPLKKTVSAANFYSYRLMTKHAQDNHLLHYRSLLNQFLVDMYAKIETERLNYITNNQRKLRAENYIHLQDALNSNNPTNFSELGQVVILPSSFTGGPRYMHERTQDAMTYVRHYGRPDLFITFTCNPKWNDITDVLLPGQKPHDRHDIISRVFHLKVSKLIHLLTKGHLFGSTTCYMYTIEWQKRGLPHVHILLWLQDRIKSDLIDQVITAEIPDPKVDPLLHQIVKSTMIHGPCGLQNSNSPCMVSGSCSKKYPRPLIKETQTGDDGYPQYRRRGPSDGGHTVTIKGVELDNRWVVPYNRVLSRIFNAHINVEFCNSVKSIKYICKYINKGSDQAVFAIEKEHNEVSRYETGRYISSSEAAWRIFCFPIHERFPPVIHLAVHLENGQRIYFTADNAAEKVHNPPQTTLLGFFDLCKEDDFAKHLLYSEVPAYYVWKSNQFVRRKRGQPVSGHAGVKKDHVLGRVYTVHPSNSECYHLRLLLHEVRGPTSFQYLKTVAGVLHHTFQSACRALGLLEDDKHWDNTLQEAEVSHSPSRIRQLFAIMLVFCQMANPLALWEKHKDSLSEDIHRQLQKESLQDDVQALSSIIYNKCLILLQHCVLAIGGQSLDKYDLPEPSNEHTEANPDYFRELAYNIYDLVKTIEDNEPKLNTEQRKVYDEVMNSVYSQNGRIFFLDAPGGTGKTFLINLLLARVRRDSNIAIAVASSGIAATLLEGGKTAHSAFKLPLNLNNTETPMCNISKQSNMAQVLRDCKLIVWDECTMAHRGGVEALHRTLQDIRNNDGLMGGLTVLLAGDFRQTLPVVPRGTRADQVKASFKSSYLWRTVKVLYLRLNMRVHLTGDVKAAEFSRILLAIGDGTLHEQDGKVNLPANLCHLVTDLKSLAQNVYPNLQNIHMKDTSWFRERAILTSTNDTTNSINDMLLQAFTSDTKTYQSVDSVMEADDAVHYPVEFLHSLNPPGIPQHNLILKVGAPIMLLRNLQPPKLCNGTRLQVKSLHKNLIEAIVFTGCGRGETVFIPRIPLIPSDLPFQFKRLQFPVRVCFAMTINKSQGQTLKVVGVDLRHDCFSHGQLYVACSRVSSADSLFILQPQGRTANVVCKEIIAS